MDLTGFVCECFRLIFYFKSNALLERRRQKGEAKRRVRVGGWVVPIKGATAKRRRASKGPSE